ncbi:MAG: Cof-type HAD-IIB family hydrolase [Lachnospiraceae bacterium]|nr:Cof-type HAD-IIB family hydrolase [Lachnospiraceae bacterium]
MAQKIRLIGFDLDGTVLDKEKRMSERTRQAIEEAIAKGILVIPVTGRPLCGIPEVIREISGIPFYITANGAAVYDAESGACLYEDGFSPEEAGELLQKIGELPVLLDVFMDGQGWMEEKRKPYVDQVGYAEAVRAYVWRTRHWVPDLAAYVSGADRVIRKISVNFPAGEDACREKILNFLKERPEFAVVSGGGGNLEITKASANKGAALAWICERRHIRPEEVLAIGDSENDLAMIRMAGIGVAMGNAEDCLKEEADYVTASNEEDGFAKALAHYSGEEEETVARALFRILLHPKEKLFSPCVFAVLTGVWAYAAWVLFCSLLAPLDTELLGVRISVPVIREWYLLAFFMNVLYYICLTPIYLSGPGLALLAAFPLCLYGAARLFCLGGAGLWLTAAGAAGIPIGLFFMVYRYKTGKDQEGKESFRRFQMFLFLVLLVLSLIYVGGQELQKRRGAKALMERGQREYLLDGNWETLRPFRQEIFSTLSEEERVKAMNELALWETTYLGLEPVIVVDEVFRKEDTSSVVLGTYRDADRLVRISHEVIKAGDRDECLNVLCHELYHAYQWALSEGRIGNGIAPLSSVERWTEALIGYKPSDVSEYREYYTQDVEATARGYAAARSEQLAVMADCLK